MSALTKARTDGSFRLVQRERRPLAAGAKVYRGAFAVCLLAGASAGYHKQAAAADVAVVVGRFREDVDNTSGLDGAAVAEIEYFRDRWIVLAKNDNGTPVAAANREAPCWMLDDQTATAAQNDTFGGVVYEVTTEGVWIEPTPSSTAEAGGGVVPAFAKSVHTPVADTTALAAIAAQDRTNGMLCLCLSDMSMWRFNSTSTAADATKNLVVAPAAGTGKWMRHDKQVALSIPVTFATADAAAIFTMPTGAIFHPREAWWDVLVSWTGGSSSAIGIATGVAGFNTAGDILGGAGGDVAATLVSTNVRETGTIGTKLATRTLGRLLMNATDTLTFNRITSAFAAGSANVRVLGDLIANPGV